MRQNPEILYESLSTSLQGEDHAPALQIALRGEFEQLKAQVEQSTFVSMSDQAASDELTRLSVASINWMLARNNYTEEEYQRINAAYTLWQKALIHARPSFADISSHLSEFTEDYATSRQIIIKSTTLTAVNNIGHEMLLTIATNAVAGRDNELFDTLLLKGAAIHLSDTNISRIAQNDQDAKDKLIIKRSFERLQDYVTKVKTTTKYQSSSSQYSNLWQANASSNSVKHIMKDYQAWWKRIVHPRRHHHEFAKEIVKRCSKQQNMSSTDLLKMLCEIEDKLSKKTDRSYTWKHGSFARRLAFCISEVQKDIEEPAKAIILN